MTSNEPPPSSAHPLQVLAMAAAYALLGLLALRLTIPPDYAAPVYPPAGLALAAVLCLGPRMLAGVALGAFTVNVLLALERGHVAVLSPALIALGATLQAGLGAAWVRRLVSQPLTLTDPADLLRFFLAGAGPVCLLSPTLSVAGLWLTGAIGPERVLTHWLQWWGGDTMGVLLGTPIALTLLAQPRSVWAPRRFSVALPLLLASLLLVLATRYVMQSEHERARHAFDRDAGHLLNLMEVELRRPLALLDATQGLMMVAPDLGSAAFRRVSESRLSGSEAVIAVGWAERVPVGQREGFEQAARQDGLADFHVHDRGRPGDFQPPATEDALAIRLIWPLPLNAGALGVNVRSVPVARDAQDRALASGLPEASAGFPLSQDQGPVHGVVIYRAVRPALTDSPSTAPLGLAFVALRPGLLLDKVRDHPERGSTPLRYCLTDLDPGQEQQPLAGDPGCGRLDEGHLQMSRRLAYAGRQWSLRVYTQQALQTGASAAGLAFAIAGLLCIALLGMLLLSISGRAARVAELVRQRTAQLQQEMTAREQATLALRESEQRFRGIVEHAPVGVVFTDLQLHPQETNPYFCRLLGYSADELKRLTITAITHPEDRAGDQPLIQQLLDGRIDRYSRLKRYLARDGQIRQVRVTVSLLRDAQQQPYRLVGVVADVSEELKRQQADRERTKAEAASQAKSDFVSRMSHELRTPLNAMLGFAQLLDMDRSQPLSERQRNAVMHIQQAGWHLLEMINDTLDLARIESGQYRVEPAALDLTEQLRQCLSLVEAERAKRGVQVALEVAPDATVVLADPLRLRQVLTNLLSNAIKYNVEGGRVHVGTRRSDDGSAIEVRVRDTGLGMTPEQLAQLFQPFNRLGREDGPVPGTGIGLVIAQRLCELMGGRLEVSSTVQEGTEFTLRLPLPAQESASPGTMDAQQSR